MVYVAYASGGLVFSTNPPGGLKKSKKLIGVGWNNSVLDQVRDTWCDPWSGVLFSHVCLQSYWWLYLVLLRLTLLASMAWEGKKITRLTICFVHPCIVCSVVRNKYISSIGKRHCAVLASIYGVRGEKKVDPSAAWNERSVTSCHLSLFCWPHRDPAFVNKTTHFSSGDMFLLGRYDNNTNNSTCYTVTAITMPCTLSVHA